MDSDLFHWCTADNGVAAHISYILVSWINPNPKPMWKVYPVISVKNTRMVVMPREVQICMDLLTCQGNCAADHQWTLEFRFVCLPSVRNQCCDIIRYVVFYCQL